jgi:hypothetical protein
MISVFKTRSPVSEPEPCLILVSWDGQSAPLALVDLDVAPAFSWILFDYSGKHHGTLDVGGRAIPLLSAATECKGEIYTAFADYLSDRARLPEYVALIDDDVALSVSDINRALELGRRRGLDVFSPTLSHDSYFSHDWMLTQGKRTFRKMERVEVMMPFYRGSLFASGREHYRGNISSWGIDCYLMPMLQQLSGCTRTALLDTVVASHRRPVASGGRTFRNGLTAWDEMKQMKEACIRHIEVHAPQLQRTKWFIRLFLGKQPDTLVRRMRQRLKNVLRV